MFGVTVFINYTNILKKNPCLAPKSTPFFKHSGVCVCEYASAWMSMDTDYLCIWEKDKNNIYAHISTLKSKLSCIYSYPVNFTEISSSSTILWKLY